MINIDLDKSKMHVVGEFKTCFKEWIAVTGFLYKTATSDAGLTEASRLFSRALVEACKAGAEELEDKS